ncbi:MAG: glycosyltransferase family 4 protein [Rubricoccaceae bacterium]
MDLVTAFMIAMGAAFSATLLATPAFARWAVRHGWIDRPDAERKRHARPTPVGGGVAIVAGVLAGMAALAALPGIALPFSPAVLLGGVLIVLTGLRDDARGVGFKSKFLVQIIVAYVLMAGGYRLDPTGLPFVGEDAFQHALIAIPLTLLWIVGVINAVNLTDGADGLAAGTSMIGFAALAAVFTLGGHLGLAACGLVIAAALAAFLRYNTNPASIFMGDTGSLFLGYALAVYGLSARTHADPWLAIAIPALAAGFPILDTALAFLRRAVQRRAICAPDADHIHHRLIRRMSVRRSVGTLYALSGCFGLAAILISVSTPRTGFAVVATMVGAAGMLVHQLGYFRRTAADEKIFSSDDSLISEPGVPMPVAPGSSVDHILMPPPVPASPPAGPVAA